MTTQSYLGTVIGPKSAAGFSWETQTDYLPVYGAWAAMVVVLFPPLFRYT
jgi:hypothetical protein